MANVNPPQPVPQLGPQPDIARITQDLQQAATSLGNAATEVANFANLPPIAQGNALIHQMQQLQHQVQQQTQQQQQFQQQMQQQMQQQQQFQQQMQAQMQQLQQQMQQQTQQQQQFQQQTNLNFDAVRNDIQTLRNDFRTSRQATEHNAIARLENSTIRRSTNPLVAFRDPATNTDIPGFPATFRALETMRAVTLDPILTSLDLPLTGDIEARRKRLGVYIGLTILAS